MGAPKAKDLSADLEQQPQYRNIRNVGTAANVHNRDARSPDEGLFTRQSNYATAVIAKGSLQYDDSSTGNQARKHSNEGDQSVVSSNFKSNTQVIKNFNDMVAAPTGRRNPSGSAGYSQPTAPVTYESSLKTGALPPEYESQMGQIDLTSAANQQVRGASKRSGGAAKPQQYATSVTSIGKLNRNT